MSAERLDYMIFPRLIALGERAWNPEPTWTKNQSEFLGQWNSFVNTLGQKDLPRLDYFHGGILYRIPTPGVIIEEGTLKINSEIPGFTYRYTTNGAEPDENSTVYSGPIAVQGTVKVKAFATNGRSSRTVSVK